MSKISLDLGKISKEKKLKVSKKKSLYNNFTEEEIKKIYLNWNWKFDDKTIAQIIEIFDQVLIDFPLCFFKNNTLKRPIKREIKNELTENYKEKFRGIDLQNFLFFYCHDLPYLETFEKYVYRIDLEGFEVEEIPDDQKIYARSIIKKIKKRLVAKK